MALTCPNGHVNDDANRFCDQCGLPLQAAQGDGGSAATATASAMPAVGSNCPVCGQENVPGTAFCDNCGAQLPPPQPATVETGSPSIDVMSTGGSDAVALSASGDDAALTCPQCGSANDAANRFCDNCGAALGGASATDAAVESIQGDATPAPAAVSADLAASPSTPLPTEGIVPPILPDPLPADLGTLAPAATMPTGTDAASSGGSVDAADLMGMDGISTATPAAPAVSAAPSTADSSAERQRLEERITQQRQLVSQLEGMQQQFGAATPPAILQGLDEARSALAQAETDLQALPSAQPAPDPAEVARLEERIAQQRQLVSQLEGMQQQFGAATPPAILQGLDEARASLASAEGELQALTGSSQSGGKSSVLGTVATIAAAAAAIGAVGAAAAAATKSTTPEPEPEAAPPSASVVRTYEQTAPPPVPAPAPAPAPMAAPVPAATPRGTDQLPPAPAQTTGPRLVARDGAFVSLPRDGREIVVGREDPISGIHPDVDMTPHGGEAGGVSRRHAVIREQNGQWTVTDLNSTNYTRVDGNRLAPDTPTPIQDGSRVQFGRVELVFHTS